MSKELANKKILITGGAGFIGSNLCEYFVESGNEVICLDNLLTGFRENIAHLESKPNFTFVEGDILDYDLCVDVVKGVDYVLHQAALGSVPRSIENPLNTNAHNISGFLNVIEASSREGVKRFVFAASSSTYGDHKALPKVEENIGKPLSPYAVTKYVNELYAKVYSDLYGLETIGLRYFNVFGRRQSPSGAYAAVIPKFIELLINNEPIKIHGDGEQTRDFTHIDNVIKANELALMTDNSESLNTIYNVAYGGRISLNALVSLIKDSFDELGIDYQNFQVEHGPNRTGDIRDSFASIDKAKNLLGYEPVVSLEEGMKRFIKFYLSQKSQ